MKPISSIFFFIIYFAISFLWLLYTRRHIMSRREIIEVLQLPGIWAFPILMFLVGLLFSKLYSYFRKTKNKKFILGQLTCVGITVPLFTYTVIDDWRNPTHIGNLEYNRDIRKYSFP